MIQQRTRPKSRTGSWTGGYLLLQVVVIGGFFLAWEYAIDAFEVPAYILPKPSGVAIALYDGLMPPNATLLPHIWVTVQEVVYGYAIGAGGGFVLGILIGESRILRTIVHPFIVAIQVTPKTALVPLFIIWFGFGIASKVFIVILITFFPVVVNTIAGLHGVELQRLDLMRSYRAGRLKTLMYMKIPSAMPSVFSGLEVAVVLAILGAIVGEFLGARAGLGRTIITAGENLDMELVFAAIALLIVMGLVAQGVIQLVRRRVLFWQGK